jgi:hypothetical protein
VIRREVLENGPETRSEDDELEGVCKEAVTPYFKVLFRVCSEETEEKQNC